MVVCEHCKSKNSLDGQFCKGCGREISESAIEEAKAENSRLIAEGYSMLGEGRTEEAELISKAVLEADETVASAWSLLGMVYERKGEWVGALECYEKVLHQNPDSALDKIKVTQLRNSIQRQIQPEVKPNKKMALAGAMAAIVFMGTTGAILATTMARNVAANEPVDRSLVANISDGQPFGQGSSVKQSQPTTEGGNSSPETQNLQPGDVAAVRDGVTGGQNDNRGTSVGNQGAGRTVPDYRGPSTGGGAMTQLPDPTGNGQGRNVGNGGGVDPINPFPNGINIEAKPPGPPGSDPNEPAPDRGVTISDGGSRTQNDPPVVSPQARQGTIDIKVRKGNETSGGSQDIGSNANGVDAVMKSARERHMAGQFGDAAKSYEKARQMGNDNGSVNQRLGMVYEKLNRKSDAAAAYQRAIPRLEEDARSGKAGAKEALESAKQALKNIKG